jgi:hypothetical protein
MPGHSRQDTALIHGLSTSDVDRLAEACVEAKSKAYCTFPFEDACIGLALSVVLKTNNLINNACMNLRTLPYSTNQTHTDPDNFLSIRPILEIPCRLRSAVVRRHDRDRSQCRERRLPRWNLRGASGDCYGCDPACKGTVLACIFYFCGKTATDDVTSNREPKLAISAPSPSPPTSRLLLAPVACAGSSFASSAM